MFPLDNVLPSVYKYARKLFKFFYVDQMYVVHVQYILSCTKENTNIIICVENDRQLSTTLM
jgi:hypothetical protein